MKTITLDPGHGGHDPGAIGPTGLRESDMVLDIVLRAEKLLATPHLRVILTRRTDIFLPLHRRPAMANGAESDAFISYHLNSAERDDIPHSWEIFTTRGQNRSDKLATCIGKRHAALFPGQKQRSDRSDGDLDKEANFAVLRGTDHPAVLMEGEFIHTIHGESLIADPDNRQKMALAITAGALDFLGIEQISIKIAAPEPPQNPIEAEIAAIDIKIAANKAEIAAIKKQLRIPNG